jgi:hypothetical protein
MRLFGPIEAANFCKQYSSNASLANTSTEAYSRIFRPGQTIREGNPRFDELRTCILRDAERALFLSVSHYRRALDLMLVSGSPWAQVTLYYGSWFAAHALLGLFGGAVLKSLVIDVSARNPGKQALATRSVNSLVPPRTGSHQAFWDLFYAGVAPLVPRVAPALQPALTPVKSNSRWQIAERNRVNYSAIEAISAGELFSTTFDAATFPASLPGSLATQFRIQEGLLEIAFQFLQTFGVETGALTSLGQSTLRESVRTLVYDAAVPNLVGKTRKAAFV